MSELPKTFDPAEIEARWYAHWEERGAVPPGRGPRPSRSRSSSRRPTSPARSISATRSTITLQDILTRHARLQGKDALWVVGTDHAGIATQMVVERQLERAAAEAHRFHPRGVRRQGLGVEGGERRRDHPPAAPARRLAATGRTSASPWTRASRRAVLKVFVELYNRRACSTATSGWSTGTRASRPRSPTSRSRRNEVQGQFWHFSLPARGRLGRDLGRHDAARDDARRHGGGGASRRRALRGAGRQEGAAADHRPAGPDHRRRACRSGARLGRGQDHAGPRFQRFRGRQARRLQARRDAQHARSARRGSSRPPTA